MGAVTRVAGLVAGLAVMLDCGAAGAQVYPPPIANPPPPAPRYYQPPAEPAPYAYHHRYAHRYYAHYYRHYHRYAYAGCGYRRHRAGAIGAVAGAVGGGIIGGAISHGNPAFTMIGAGAGALTGHAIGRSSGC
jgi:hypothetical protein